MWILKLAVLILVIDLNPLVGGSSQERGFLDYLLGPCKCKCGIPNREARLAGGAYLRNHEFPWFVQIQVNGQEPKPGTLINNKYVLTGASQMMGLTAYDVKVTMAQHDRCHPDVTSTNVSVDKILIHPDYSPNIRANDLALIKLTSPINFERRIAPICLGIPGNSYLGQVATVVGWKTLGNNTYDCRPHKVGLPVLGRAEQCMQMSDNSSKYALTLDKGCLGVVGANSIVCDKDGGGPVMYRSQKGVYELIGILSDLNQCFGEESKVAALYTNINDHLTWITKNTKDSCYCFKV